MKPGTPWETRGEDEIVDRNGMSLASVYPPARNLIIKAVNERDEIADALGRPASGDLASAVYSLIRKATETSYENAELRRKVAELQSRYNAPR